MKVLTNLSENLRVLRNRHKYTQRYVAEKLGIQRARYERWEDGVEPPLIHVLNIANFYNVTVNDLLTVLPINNNN